MATLNIQADQEFEFVERVRRKLQMWLALSRAIEEVLADLVAAYTPLLAPIIPATIGFWNVKDGLGFGIVLAFIYAVVVEFLGISTTTTALQFRAWNKEQSSKAPLWLAVVMAVFYMSVVLTVNVLLDTGTDLQKGVKAAASLFSIVGAVTMALRNEQAKRVAEKLANDLRVDASAKATAAQNNQAWLEADERAKADRLAAEEREYQRKVADEERAFAHKLELLKEKQKVSGKFPEVAEVLPEVTERLDPVSETHGKYDDWRQVPAEERKKIAGMSTKQVMSTYGKKEKTARNWRNDAVTEYGQVP